MNSGVISYFHMFYMVVRLLQTKQKILAQTDLLFDRQRLIFSVQSMFSFCRGYIFQLLQTFSKLESKIYSIVCRHFW